MKKILVLCMVIPVCILHAQEKGDCKVMVSALQGTYDGGCKNGMAQGKGSAKGTDTYTGNFRKGYPHGRGTYTWASGDMYEGIWNMGMREGEGTLKTTRHGRDSVLTGIWKNDRYEGPKPIAPTIIQTFNVVSTTFNRTGEGSKISISFFQNGLFNNVESLEIVANSGNQNRAGRTTSFYDIRFPFRCKLNYLSWNSLKTFQYSCILEFEISQPGSWDLRVGN
jgi:hypothetical protein